MSSSYEVVLYQTAGGAVPWTEWLVSLRDVKARLAVERRIQRLSNGNFGDRKSLGGGLWELRIDYGPGYRAYYSLEGTRIVLLLCGGDKRRQDADIARARSYKADYEQR